LGGAGHLSYLPDCRGDDLKSLQQEGFNFYEFFELTDMPGTLTSAPWLLTLAGHFLIRFHLSRRQLLR
jgi:hypothetical protein